MQTQVELRGLNVHVQTCCSAEAEQLAEGSDGEAGRAESF